MSQKENLENSIKALFELWVEEKNKEKLKKIRYSGPSFGKEEYTGIMDAIFSDWWSGGKYTFRAEEKLAEILNIRKFIYNNDENAAEFLNNIDDKRPVFKKSAKPELPF